MVNRYTKLDAWRPLYPFESQWLHLNCGVRMHYVDQIPGEGGNPNEVILCLHGNPTWSFFYRELVKNLGPSYRLVVPDHIGCGLSDKPQDYAYNLKTHINNLEELVERLNLPPFTLVVHDWGGAIGMGYAVRHPEMVKRVLFMNTAAFTSKLMPCTIRLARVPLLGALLVRGLNAFVLGALAIGSVTDKGPYVWNGYMHPYRSWNDRVGVLRFVQDIPMGPSHPSYSTLKEIEDKLPCLAGKPMAFIWGGKDHVFTKAFYERWQRIFPQAEFTFLPNVGHMVPEDASEKVIRKLEQMLAQPTPEA